VDGDTVTATATVNCFWIQYKHHAHPHTSTIQTLAIRTSNINTTDKHSHIVPDPPRRTIKLTSSSPIRHHPALTRPPQSNTKKSRNPQSPNRDRYHHIPPPASTRGIWRKSGSPSSLHSHSSALTDSGWDVEVEKNRGASTTEQPHKHLTTDRRQPGGAAHTSQDKRRLHPQSHVSLPRCRGNASVLIVSVSCA
jgi:hypothetical protein